MTYQGSKAKYSKYINPIIQKVIDDNKIDTFYDVCCGGCNIIKDIKCKNKIAIDKNKYLIAFYNKVKQDGFEIITPMPNRQDWDLAKAYDKSLEDWYIGFIQTFCSFGAGGFKNGRMSDENIRYYGRQRTFIKDISKLKDIEFISGDYSCIKDVKNCVLYFDPPYANTRKYDIGKDFNYEDFWKLVKELSKNNYVFVSESTAPEDAKILWEKDVSRMVKGKKYPATERLYTFNEV